MVVESQKFGFVFSDQNFTFISAISEFHILFIGSNLPNNLGIHSFNFCYFQSYILYFRFNFSYEFRLQLYSKILLFLEEITEECFDPSWWIHQDLTSPSPEWRRGFGQRKHRTQNKKFSFANFRAPYCISKSKFSHNNFGDSIIITKRISTYLWCTETTLRQERQIFYGPSESLTYLVSPQKLTRMTSPSTSMLVISSH